ncbi:MAG: J domain-containing protein [Alphaproteobacteria bacterium]|nr:J domain-containing protein [Alphaproteobacteria bacterium]
MSERYDYRPPLGFDIRIAPEGERRRARYEAPPARTCEWPGCGAAASHRVPRSPRMLEDRAWYCLAHVREHNQNWNYFAGMSPEDIARYQKDIATGHRPTWKLGDQVGGRFRGAHGFRGDLRDPHALFEEERAQREAERRRTPRLTRLQLQALELFDLDETATRADLRARYKLLLKRFHPDTNGGDRSTEKQLQRVIKAYDLLKGAQLP